MAHTDPFSAQAASESETDGSALLDELRETLTNYVILPSREASDAVSLWIAATHALPAFQTATRLAIKSPEKRCGKSRLLDIVSGTCRDPLMTVNATVNAIFRSLGGDHPPTLLIDEADALFGTKRQAEQNEDLRALINAGYQRGRDALRCSGPQLTPTKFSTFAMVALAGIGDLPDTITDRAVNITMRRRAPGEGVAPFRSRHDEPLLHDLRDRLGEWAEAIRPGLELASPLMPVEDRAADTWEPLVMVADAAGGTWPGRARAACLKLTADHDAANEEASLSTRLLADIRRVFTTGRAPFIASADLVAALREIEESPWSDFELNARKLAYRLRHFGVVPGHDTTKTRRGYRLEDLCDAFARYLRPDPSEPSDTLSDQGKHPDGLFSPDGSTRPDDMTRPDVSAGRGPIRTDGRVRTDPAPEHADPSPCSVRPCDQSASGEGELGGQNWQVCPDHGDMSKLAIEGDHLIVVGP